MGALFEITKFSGTLRACEQPETENKMRSIYLWYCRCHKVILGKFDLPVC